MKEERGEGDKERAERYLSELRYIITVEGTRRAGDNSSVEYVSKSRERKPFSSPRLIVHRVRYITWNFSSSRSIVITRVRICVLRLEIQVEIHATYSVIFKRVVTNIALEYFSSFEDSIFFFFFFKSRKEESPVKNWNHRNDTDGVDESIGIFDSRVKGGKFHCENSKVDIGSRTFTQQVLRNAWKTFKKISSQLSNVADPTSFPIQCGSISTNRK